MSEERNFKLLDSEDIIEILNSLEGMFLSTSLCDRNMRPSSVVDVINELARSTDRIAQAITPIAAPGTDAGGGHVESLTEAVMGCTGGMHEIASSIRSLAEAVGEVSQAMRQA